MQWLNTVTGPIFIVIALVAIGVVLDRFEKRADQNEE